MTPIDGVLFDFNFTLVHEGRPARWLELAARRLGREPLADRTVTGFLEHVWGHAHAIDPHSRRDTDPTVHRDVFIRTVAGLPGVDPELADALYDSLLDVWVAYDDAAPTLKTLRQNGIRVAVVSNIGLDVRPVLAREGLADLVDAVVMSYRVGFVKPETGIFRHALRLLAVPAERALMVGDSWRADAGASELGVRSLVLPRTDGPEHGLDAVLRLVG